MKNIIIVAHFSNSIFTRLDIQCSNKCSISATLVVKLKRSLACLDFLWTAKPVQAKITLWGVLIECDFHQSECCSEQKLIQWRARAFNWKPCLSRKTKTKLGNKNGYFFEIFSSSRRFHYKSLIIRPYRLQMGVSFERTFTVFLFWTSVFVPSGSNWKPL